MITVQYHSKNCSLTVDGHAYSGEAGNDIVCAAASILAYTLAANVQEMEAADRVREVTLELEQGHAEISCRPVHKYQSVAELVFSSVCAGFEILAANFPGNISYQIYF